jgi:hypothetical protein
MNTIPCKRPKVTIEARLDADTVIVRCHVPRCGFQYPADLQYHALKSDADGQATMHRQGHRAAVPKTTLEKGPTGAYWATCACGWSNATHPGVTTRTDVAMALDYHLSTAHGLVTC